MRLGEESTKCVIALADYRFAFLNATYLEHEQLTLWVGSTKSQVAGLLAGSSSRVGVDIWLLLKMLQTQLIYKYQTTDSKTEYILHINGILLTHSLE